MFETLKKRELAGQSFNVVLGAILGFLSASATTYFGIRKTSKEEELKIIIGKNFKNFTQHTAEQELAKPNAPLVDLRLMLNYPA